MTQPRASSSHVDPARAATELVRRPEFDDLIQRVVVTGINGYEVYIQRTGQASADVVSYPTLGTSFTVGDEAIMIRVGAGYIVIGEVFANRLLEADIAVFALANMDGIGSYPDTEGRVLTLTNNLAAGSDVNAAVNVIIYTEDFTHYNNIDSNGGDPIVLDDAAGGTPPTGGKIQIVAAASTIQGLSTQPPTPLVSGGGFTWTLVAEVIFVRPPLDQTILPGSYVDGSVSRLAVFRGDGASPSGDVTVDFGGAVTASVALWMEINTADSLAYLATAKDESGDTFELTVSGARFVWGAPPAIFQTSAAAISLGVLPQP